MNLAKLTEKFFDGLDVVEVTDAKEAQGYLESKASSTWANGPIEGTGWVLLAQPSKPSNAPAFRKRTVFVCKIGLVQNLELTEIDREVFGGGDGRAINRHSRRTYKTNDNRFVVLDKTLDMCPPHYEIIGPYSLEHDHGVTPTTNVAGERYFAGDKSWRFAVSVMAETLQATITNRPASDRVRIRKGGLGEDLWLDRNGEWVSDMKRAATFKPEAADKFAEAHGITDYGTF